MRKVVACLGLVVLIGCAKPEQQPATDTAAAAVVTPPPPAAISLADLAGKWAMTTMTEAGDSTLLKYELVATGDTTGWTLNFPKRKPLPVRVSVSGDSLIIDAGPYESMLRKGVQVTTHSVSRLENGTLAGKTVAHYTTKGADTVRVLKTEGKRMQ